MSLMSIQPRDGRNLDYVQCFDEGCVKSRKNQLIQAIIANLSKADKNKEVMRARKQFKPYSDYHPENPQYGREKFGEKARKQAENIIELERKAHVKFREKKLFDRLVFIRNQLKACMFAVDDDGKVVKATFINKVVDGQTHFHQSSISFFGERNIEGMKSIESLLGARRKVAYMIPYANPEIKVLWEETTKLATPDHYENWHSDRPIQVYGGERYSKEDAGLNPEKWRKKVKKRAKDLMKKNVD